MRNQMRPIHPGEVLREEFVVPLGISGTTLAQALCVPASRINAILKESRDLTAATALRLASFFGTTPEFWMNLQKTYELRLAEVATG
jgi:antitoxin HigA-1